ncbi:unnamed protein product [Prunus armeniaca]
MRSWFWDRRTTAGQLLTGVADLFLAILLAHLFSGLWKKTLGDTDSSGKTATSNSFQTDKADSDRWVKLQRADWKELLMVEEGGQSDQDVNNTASTISPSTSILRLPGNSRDTTVSN